MRMIGKLSDEAAARRFGDYLTLQGVTNDVEAAAEGWAIWVHNEDHLESAEKELERFRENPGDARYRDAHQGAAVVRKEQAEEQQQFKQNQINVRGRWSRRAQGFRPVTTVMLVASIIVALATGLGENRNAVMDALAFGEVPTNERVAELIRARALETGREAPSDEEILDELQRVGTWEDLRDQYGVTGFELIARGQFWRLVTTMFLHFGLIHLIFNMYWLHYLGGQIEAVKGKLYLVVIVLASSAAASIGQNLVSGPSFGGMSAVNYGLFGYIWMMMRYQPREGLGLPSSTVLILMAWLVICMTGVVGPVANTAHVVGLVVGMGAGLLPPSWTPRRKGRPGA